MDPTLHISREELYQPLVDSTLAHAKALTQQTQPVAEEPVSPLRRVLLSPLFFTPLAGLLGGVATWLILEPHLDDASESEGAFFLLFPMTATMIVLFIFVADGFASRRLRGNMNRWLSNLGLTLLFSLLALVPMGILFRFMIVLPNPPELTEAIDITAWHPTFFFGFIILRSLCWGIFGAALGFGVNVLRSTRAQQRASLMGGIIGGVVGGLLFDPINRFLFPSIEQGDLMRFVGLAAIGLSVGLFVALSERLGREGWLRVRTGPLRGKAFILYHNPTIIGSSPASSIYLIKDKKVAPQHASLHRSGSGYEIASCGGDAPILINNIAVGRRRLVSGDQITLGDTILDFEERARKRSRELVKDEPAVQL
ncbi:MAG TPA: FHA domain-containing protein [Pyrinomonadaceae bacterium]|nr:FHA domain-containing protein [Pyrinomonadaceae bacterium]